MENRKNRYSDPKKSKKMSVLCAVLLGCVYGVITAGFTIDAVILIVTGLIFGYLFDLYIKKL